MPHAHASHLTGEAPAQPNPPPTPSDEDSFDWVYVAAFILFLMQLGLALIQSGSVRFKATQATLVKLLFNLTLGLIVWWLFGYGLAYGEDKGAFIGWSKFAGTDFTDESAFAHFLLRTGLALLAASIVSQVAAERVRTCSWPVYLVFFLGWIYPVQAHWSLGHGWLLKVQYHDFAGCGAVHLVSGTAALVIAVLLKLRSGPLLRYSQFQVAAGSILLFALWLFLVASSGFRPLHETDASEAVRAHVALNTLLSGAVAGIVAFELAWLQTKKYNLFAFSRGLIAGVVVVSGACDSITQWAALLFGLFGGIVYHVLSSVLATKIEDPADIVAVHLGAGLVGTIFTGLFHETKGVFYNQGAALLGGQLVGLIVYIAWTAFFTAIPLVLLKGLGQLRITDEIEKEGFDKTDCGGDAVNYYVEQHLEETPPSPPRRQPPAISGSFAGPVNAPSLIKSGILRR